MLLRKCINTQVWNIKTPLQNLIRWNSEQITLREVIAEKIAVERDRIALFRKEYGNIVVDAIKVNTIYDGMHNVTALIYDTSSVDPVSGVLYRGHTIKEICYLLPKAEGSEQPLPEGLFWLLLTGDIPTKEQVKQITEEWTQRSPLPQYIVRFINNMPKFMHPLTQLSCAVTAMTYCSKFRRAYNEGVRQVTFWEYTYEDAMDLIARLPLIAATIYCNLYRTCPDLKVIDPLDWTSNFVRLLNFENSELVELMRLYFVLYADYDGGNVIAHTTHMVNTALCDPFLSFGAGLNCLASPLQSAANVIALNFLRKLQKDIGEDPKDGEIYEYIMKLVKSGQTVPGYGHEVLRNRDPRFLLQQEFGDRFMAKDYLFRLATRLSILVPPILQQFANVENPWPNVDSNSAALFHHYKLTQEDYYSVLFALSRCFGLMAQAIWAQALLLPMEQSQSISTDSLIRLTKTKVRGTKTQL